MKITFVQFLFYPDFSAVAQLLGDLTTYLAKQGHEVTVVCGTSRYSGDGKKAARFAQSYKGVKIIRFPTFNFGKGNFVFRLLDYSSYYFLVFWYVLFSGRQDLIVSMTSPPLIGFVVVMAGLFKRVRIAQYIEDLYPDILFDLGLVRKPWLARRLHSVGRKTLNLSDRIIVIGDYMKEKIQKRYLIRNEKIKIMENWAGVSSVISSDKTGNPRPLFDPDPFLLLYSGNMGLAHDFTQFGRFVKNMKGIADISYRFVGGGERTPEVKRIFEEAGERRVEFTGYTSREEHKRVLAKASVYLIAQRFESVGDILPSKIYSYLAGAKPLLFFGPQASEIGDLILREDIGFVVEKKSDIAEAVEYLLLLKEESDYYNSVSNRVFRLFSRAGSFDSRKSVIRQVFYG